MSPRPGPGARFDRRRRLGDVRFVVGVDEVGRGCLAGPVVAAAVVLPERNSLHGIRDSKAIPAPERAELARAIRATALAVGLSFVGPRVIDAINIRQSSLRAMARAVSRLRRLAHTRGLAREACGWIVLVDGIDTIPGVDCAQESVIAGDARSEAIAAASIVAKVARDALMVRLAAEHPAYLFDQNKGYGTPEHVEAIDRVGPCRWHRHTFAPVAQTSLAFESFA